MELDFVVVVVAAVVAIFLFYIIRFNSIPLHLNTYLTVRNVSLLCPLEKSISLIIEIMHTTHTNIYTHSLINTYEFIFSHINAFL